jgi:hypothetical protein
MSCRVGHRALKVGLPLWSLLFLTSSLVYLQLQRLHNNKLDNVNDEQG